MFVHSLLRLFACLGKLFFKSVGLVVAYLCHYSLLFLFYEEFLLGAGLLYLCCGFLLAGGLLDKPFGGTLEGCDACSVKLQGLFCCSQLIGRQLLVLFGSIGGLVHYVLSACRLFDGFAVGFQFVAKQTLILL